MDSLALLELSFVCVWALRDQYASFRSTHLTEGRIYYKGYFLLLFFRCSKKRVSRPLEGYSSNAGKRGERNICSLQTANQQSQTKTSLVFLEGAPTMLSAVFLCTPFKNLPFVRLFFGGFLFLTSCLAHKCSVLYTQWRYQCSALNITETMHSNYPVIDRWLAQWFPVPKIELLCHRLCPQM